MPAYRTDPLILIEGKQSDTDVASIVVEPGSGNVQVQLKGSDDEWFTPADESYTLTAADTYVLPRRNRPEVRIIAILDAQFYVIGV